MEDRRKLYRFFPPFLNDQYFSREEKGSREQCVILNISRKGVGLKFHTGKKIKPGAAIYLEMYVPGESEPINLKGTLKWIWIKNSSAFHSYWDVSASGVH